MSKQTDLINIPDAITVSGSNVGIGTSSPSRQLEIYDDGTVGQAVLALTAQNTDPSRIMFADPDDVNIGILDYHHSDNSMRFIVNNAESMRIDSSGNVGIGANPSTSLGAGDNTAYIGADGEIQIRRAAGTGRNMMKFRNGSNHVGSITTDANKVSLLSLSGDLIFGTNNTERMRIDSSGHAIIPAGVTLGTSAGVYAAANTLDDYEEGTFTLTLNGVSGGAFGVGLYVKVGGLVHFQWYSNGAITVSSSTGGFVGLPFTTASGAYYATFSSSHNTYTPNASGGYLNTGTNSGVFTNNGTVTSAPASVGSGRYLMVAGTYKTNS